jgi:hypothetical protein
MNDAFLAGTKRNKKLTKEGEHIGQTLRVLVGGSGISPKANGVCATPDSSGNIGAAEGCGTFETGIWTNRCSK